MANKLHIYACSGIGDAANELKKITFWTDKTDTLSNTQAVNGLLTLINLREAELEGITATDADKTMCRQDITLYKVCLYFAKNYAGNNEMLTKAGIAINKLLMKGAFERVKDTQEEIAKELFISQAQVSRLEKSAISSLKKLF